MPSEEYEKLKTELQNAQSHSHYVQSPPIALPRSKQLIREAKERVSEMWKRIDAHLRTCEVCKAVLSAPEGKPAVNFRSHGRVGIAFSQ